jgi:type I restriction enzyme, S subunit
MSAEWAEFSLGSVTTWLSGGTPNKGNPSFWGGYIPWISANSMYGTRFYDSDLKITESGLVAGSRLAPANSILLLVRGGALHNRLPVGIAGRSLAFNQDVKALIPDSNRLDPWFLLYWLIGNKKLLLGEIVEETGIGAGKLDTKRMQALPMWLPPLAVQRKIAQIAQSIDDKIDLNRRINQTLEAMAQAIFKSWFVDFDPVKAKIAAKAGGRDPLRAAMSAISGKTEAELDTLPPEAFAQLAATAALFPDEMEESELGGIPKGWAVASIREIVEGVYDGPHATPAESTCGPVFLGIRNLTGTALDLSNIRHIAEDDWAQWTRRVTPRAGDIVFSYEATLGYFALLPDGLRCCLGRRLALVRPQAEQGFGTFWFHQFVAPPFQRLLEKHTIPGATVNRIALKDFPSFPVLSPPLALQAEFTSRVEPMWAAIHAHQAESQGLADLRDTLLPKLLSGELSVPEVLAEAGA